MVLFYNLLLILSPIIGFPLLLVTLAQAKHRATIMHRLGLTIDSGMDRMDHQDRHGMSIAQHRGRPIWIHALSLGEVLSAEPIVDRLAEKAPHQPLVLSTSTLTGFRTAGRLFGQKTRMVFYFPYDFYFSVRRVVKRIDPCLMVIIETDLWPNFLNYMKKKGIPVLLTNARLSRRSFRHYRLGGRFVRQVLSCIDGFGVQSIQDADLFRRLGAPPDRISVLGNVKFDQAGLNAPTPFGRRLRATLGFDQTVRIVVAGSTHGGEEDVLVQTFKELQTGFEDMMMVLAPRNPERAADVAKLCRHYGYQAGFLSRLDRPFIGSGQKMLIVNSIGILRHLYALADIVFVGGSLVPLGGHNPLEAAALAKPIVFGPHMSDFNVIADLLTRAGAAACASNREQLVHALTVLLSDEHYRTGMGQKAHAVFMANKGATDRTVDLITAYLSQDIPSPMKAPGS